jgi:flagellar biosynthetic protein FliR
MEWLYQTGLSQFIIFTLVLTRISGLMMTSPVFGSQEVPIRIRALVALAMALVITPTQLAASVQTPTTLVGYGALVTGEILIGLSLGLGIQILLVGPQIAGQVISQLSGISLADVFNPSLETDLPLVSHLLYLFTLAIFLTIGGHRLVMTGLLDTFRTMPLGGDGFFTSFNDPFTTLFAQTLDLGVRIAAPATTALLLATMILGLISRTVPQLNVMAVGFGISAMTTLGMLSLSLAGIAWVFEAQLEPFVEALLVTLHGGEG